jgi:hypothetical protein
LGIWRRRGEKNNWVRIHHMDTWMHRILQMRNKSRGSLFSTWTNWGRTRKESGFFLMKTGGSLRGFELPRTSGSFVSEDFQIPITSWFLWFWFLFRYRKTDGCLKNQRSVPKCNQFSHHLFTFNHVLNLQFTSKHTTNSTKNGACSYLLACLTVHSHLMWNQC